jgi:hypothetical protein
MYTWHKSEKVETVDKPSELMEVALLEAPALGSRPILEGLWTSHWGTTISAMPNESTTCLLP